MLTIVKEGSNVGEYCLKMETMGLEKMSVQSYLNKEPLAVIVYDEKIKMLIFWWTEFLSRSGLNNGYSTRSISRQYWESEEKYEHLDELAIVKHEA